MKRLIKATCISIIGNVRESHEDNFYFCNTILKEKNNGLEIPIEKTVNNLKNPIFGLFDGMGGLPYGEKASHMAALELKRIVEEKKYYSIKEIINRLNEKIKKYKSGKVKIGTTVSIIRFLEDNIEIGNIGDSRIYFLKGKKLIQVSKDHTDKLLYDELNISLDRKPKLIEYLGLNEDGIKIHPHIKKYSYKNITKIIMCSDGLTDLVSEEEINNILIDNNLKVLEELTSLVNERGAKDNTTIILFDLEKNK